VHDVEADFAGPDDAEDRVEVRAVVVDEAADAMDDLDNLARVLIEEAERVRVR